MFKTARKLLLLWVIIIFAMGLRVYKMDYYPIHNNDDSLFHVWAGTSSFKNILKPSSLTVFLPNNNALFWYSQYNNTDAVRRFSFRLEQPYFDQPPLAMFLIALPAKLFGFVDFVQVPQILVRLPAIIASIFSLYLTYVLAKKLFEQKVAFLSLIVYSFTPFYVFSHRQSYLENFLTPLILLALILLRNYVNKVSKVTLYFLIAISIIAGWIKVIGFGLFFITSFWLLKNKKTKPFLLNMGSGFISVILYFAYGAIINWPQFKFMLFSQAGRGIYLGSFIHILTQPEFYEPFKDGFYFFNFIAMFSLIIQKWDDKKIRFLCLNFLFWLLLILLTSGVNNNSPWYRYPLFPFLSIAAGYYLNLLIANQNLILIFPLLLFGFANLELLNYFPNSNVLRILYLIILTPYVLTFLFPTIKYLKVLTKITTISLLLAILFINILVPLRYLATRCQKSDCLLPEKIMIDFTQ